VSPIGERRLRRRSIATVNERMIARNLLRQDRASDAVSAASSVSREASSMSSEGMR
jgi:hypothetical protein